jgi:hypothetical protein
MSLGEPLERTIRVGISLTPTLVFTLVLADMLRTEFGVSDYIIGGLVLYAVVNTSLPAFLLRTRPPEFERPIALEVGGAARE